MFETAKNEKRHIFNNSIMHL